MANTEIKEDLKNRFGFLEELKGDELGHSLDGLQALINKNREHSEKAKPRPWCRPQVNDN